MGKNQTNWKKKWIKLASKRYSPLVKKNDGVNQSNSYNSFIKSISHLKSIRFLKNVANIKAE